MKPLPSAPLTVKTFPTDEDYDVFVLLARRRAGRWDVCLSYMATEGDRRDAALMSWLTQAGVRHYAGLDIPPEMRIPLVHLWVRGDAEWPAGHHLIDLT